MRRLLLATCLSILVGVGFPCAGGRAEDRPPEPSAATVRWDAGLDGLGQAAIEALPRIRSQVASRLGWETAGAFEVVIVRSLERMREEARASVPAWAVGVALPQQGLIVVRADLLAAGQGSSLDAVLRHEWVHLAWGRRAGANRRLLPLWAEEGIAEDVGGGISVDAGAALDVAAAFNRLLPFRDLERSFPSDARDADLAYKQSRSWIQFVAGSAGWASFRAILEDLAEWPSDAALPSEAVFAARVRERTGLSVGEWVGAWRQELVQEARPWFHLVFRDVTGVLLMLLAAFGAVAFVYLFRRRRREIQRLPDPVGPGEYDHPDESAG